MNKYNYYEYSKPIKLLINTNRILNILYFVSIMFTVTSIYIIFNILDTDIQQEDYYLIIYVHVPTAWLAIFTYTLISITSFIFIINKNPLIHITTQIGLYIGVLLTFVTLVTGSLWGKPMWGTYWVWDARLTSVIVLFTFYLINIIVNYYSKNSIKNAMVSSILIIIGLINIPIIKMSVEWWNTLHQVSSITQFNSAIHISMIIPMIYVTLSIIVICSILFIYYLRIIIAQRKLNTYGGYSSVG